MVSEEIDVDEYPGTNMLRVPDCIQALQLITAHHRSQFHIPVIGITGSNGKTIVKEWLYQLLQPFQSIARSPKSYNSQIGVPLSVWSLNEKHGLGIFEAGISKTGEMERLAAIIRPTIGVLTHIGDAHNEGFRNRKEKLNEKIILFEGAEKIIYHSKSDPGNVIQNRFGKEKAFSCGTTDHDAVQVLAIQKNLHETQINLIISTVEDQPATPFEFTIPFTDDASIDNAILSFAVSYLLQPKEGEELAATMKQLFPIEMRMELKKGINNCYIINDSYSNDLSSLGIALDYLKQQAGNKPSTIILSDILQTGVKSPDLYAQVAMEIRKRELHRVIAIGEELSSQFHLFKDIAPETAFYLSTDNFLQEATSTMFRDEFILLKGARSFAFERISQWLEQKVHQTLLEINLNAISHNLQQYQKLLKPSTRVMAMVKAFGYGSGGAEIAGILQFHKVDYLGVAYADEGVELRKAGISVPIMVMNPEMSSLDPILNNTLEPEIYSFEMLQGFDIYFRKAGITSYPVHIEIETGMNRLGFDSMQVEKLGSTLRSSPSFKVQTVFTHLAASEEEAQDDFTAIQFSRFEQATRVLQSALGYNFIRHISNSAAIVRHPGMHLDMVRLGIGLYGIDSAHSKELNLQTVATLKSTVAQVKQLEKGESVSYNRRAIVDKPTRIATVRLGYADGYPRGLGNGKGKMLIHGELAPIIGTVCMDMAMIDVTNINGVKEGDDVIIFGEALSINQLAEWAGTIPYEIMTGISQRVRRVYFEE